MTANGGDAPVVLHTRVVTETGGGPDKTILNSPRFLERDGYRALCAYMHPPGEAAFGELEQRAEALGATLLSVPDRGALDVRVLRELVRICRRERVAIWHGHDYKSNALGLLVRMSHPMKLVTTVHGWVKHTSRTPLYYWIDRRAIRWYERVICVSEDLRRTCVEAGVAESRCVLLDNAIDVEQYRPPTDRAAVKRALGFDPQRLLIGAVGRLSAEKGFTLLVEAVERLIDAGLDVELAIVGEGQERRALEERIAAGRHGDRMHLLGYRSDVAAIYEAMDVFVLSSLREGLPNVVLEAMATGVPVVCTRIAGVPRLVEHEGNGLLVEPGSVDELTAGLDRLSGDASLRASFGSAGRRTVEERFSFARRMDRMRGIYDEVLGRGTGVEGRGTRDEC